MNNDDIYNVGIDWVVPITILVRCLSLLLFIVTFYLCVYPSAVILSFLCVSMYSIVISLAIHSQVRPVFCQQCVSLSRDRCI
jgi:hypothetical protein